MLDTATREIRDIQDQGQRINEFNPTLKNRFDK